MKVRLNEKEREKITVNELARFIFRLAKAEKGHGHNSRGSATDILNDIYVEGRKAVEKIGEDFTLKFYEAVALLKRRGLIMGVGYTEHRSHDNTDWFRQWLYLTSVGERSDIGKDAIILIDDAQGIVNSLKSQVSNLDPVVEQYYLESLRTCQEGFYVSSAICLGAASERIIHCLADAIIKHNSRYEQKIQANRREISKLIEYLSQNIKNLSDGIIDDSFMNDVREELDGIAQIYRRNRNKAGHPRKIHDDIGRAEQENYLHSFRRYALTIFKAIAILTPPA